jgi:hypothetical protein
MDDSPTVRGRRLIREIVRLRTDSGLSMEVAASRLDWRKSKLYRIEAGRTRISTDDLEDMLDLPMTAPQHAAPNRVRWRKSGHSTGQTDCVELAQASGAYMVRDSKNPGAARLTFAADIWQRFTGEIKQGTSPGIGCPARDRRCTANR